jgi:anti-sigma factor (TIGR02949 family)
MTQEKTGKPADCRHVERQLFHYQAGELPDAEMRSIAGHIDECAGCARREQIENELLGVLKARMPRIPAPPGLRDRIVSNLPEEKSGIGLARLWRAQWLVPVAAALLLVVLLVPGLPRLAGVLDVEREVVVVDIDCEVVGKSLAQQRLCKHPHHLNALRVTDGSYWNVGLGDETGRLIAADRELRGARLKVRGEFYAQIRTLHVDSYEVAGNVAELDSAQLLVRH